jgi:hypothetical protein
MIDPAASYKITNRKSSSALSIRAAGSSNGVRAIIFQFVDVEDQFWHLGGQLTEPGWNAPPRVSGHDTNRS